MNDSALHWQSPPEQLSMTPVAQSVPAASCGSVSLPAPTPGGTPGELAGEDACATIHNPKPNSEFGRNDSPLLWQSPPEQLSLPADEVHVWRAALDVDDAQLRRLHGLLSDDELARAERFHFEIHRRRFIAARGLLRTLLARYLDIGAAEVRFACNSFGKPCLAAGSDDAKLRFNVSHCEDLALFAFSREREVGTDLERIRPGPVDEQIAERFFSPAETAALRALPRESQAEGFFNCWTRKEAYLKARGTGLAGRLDQFDVSLTTGEPATLFSTRDEPEAASRWCLQALTPAPGFAAALAVEGRGWRLQCWQWPA